MLTLQKVDEGEVCSCHRLEVLILLLESLQMFDRLRLQRLQR